LWTAESRSANRVASPAAIALTSALQRANGKAMPGGRLHEWAAEPALNGMIDIIKGIEPDMGYRIDS